MRRKELIKSTKEIEIVNYKTFVRNLKAYGFTTSRYGGYSTKAYGGLNCSPYCGDWEDRVKANQQLLIEALPQTPKQFFIPRHSHGTKVVVVDKKFLSLSSEQQEEELNGVDALISNVPGYLLFITHADCLPLLIHDRKNNVVAVVHSGWRGTLEGIATKTLELMKERFGTSGKNVSAVIGPCISFQYYTVGKEIYDAFEEKGNFNMEQLFHWDWKKEVYHFDLFHAVQNQLLSFGVDYSEIEGLPHMCTYRYGKIFFSARRQKRNFGRLLTGIMVIDKKEEYRPINLDFLNK